MGKKKKQVRNKARDVIGDYYKTNNQYTRENRERQKTEGKREKGFKNWSPTEKLYIVVIALGLIGIFVRYVVLDI